jgi:hypothetical protein
MERVAAGDLVMVTRGLLVMDTEVVLVGNLVPNMEGTGVKEAANMHSTVTEPGHPEVPQVPPPPSTPVA